MKTLLYFVRHGQSLGNEGRIFLGHTDMGLTEMGFKQAKMTADALADVKIDLVYSSDLSRAYYTAVPHAELRGLEVITDERLRELYCGEWEGLTVDQIIERYNSDYTDAWVNDFGRFTLPNGESVQHGADRMLEVALEVARANVGKTILLASHAAVIRALWARISGVAPEDVAKNIPYPANASYSVAELVGDRLVPVSFSNDEHLGSLSTTWRD